MATNYREQIVHLCSIFANLGEDWEANLLTGAPYDLTSWDVIRIAEWVEKEASVAWGDDSRYPMIAVELRRIANA